MLHSTPTGHMTLLLFIVTAPPMTLSPLEVEGVITRCDKLVKIDQLSHLQLTLFFCLQFLRTQSSFAFRVVSGPLIFTAISVFNALRQPLHASGPVPTVSLLHTVPEPRYQIHTVLQFVPAHVDVRVCNFSERIERGLMMAYMETQRRSNEAGNVTVQVSPLPFVSMSLDR